MIKVAYILGKLHSGGKKNLVMEYYRHMDEFLAAYYGAGWRYLRAYLDDLSSGHPRTVLPFECHIPRSHDHRLVLRLVVRLTFFLAA